MAVKKKTTKRTVTVKPSPGKKTSGSPEKSELISLLDQLNRDEINWLVTQAKTIVYNHKVDDVNVAAKDLVDSKKRTKVPKKKTKESSNHDFVDIIQAGGPKNYNIVVGNARLFININVAQSLRMSQYRDSGIVLNVTDKLIASARHDQVNILILLQHLGDFCSGFDQLHRRDWHAFHFG